MDASPEDQQQSAGGALPLTGNPSTDPQQVMPPMDGGNVPTPQEPMTDAPVNPDMGGGSEIDDIFNRLSPDDQKAAKSYAESLLNRDENARNSGEEEGPALPSPQQPPVQEVYHKIDGKLVKEDCGTGLNNFCNDECKKDKRPLGKKIAVRSKSPFSSPLKK